MSGRTKLGIEPVDRTVLLSAAEVGQPAVTKRAHETHRGGPVDD